MVSWICPLCGSAFVVGEGASKPWQNVFIYAVGWDLWLKGIASKSWKVTFVYVVD